MTDRDLTRMKTRTFFLPFQRIGINKGIDGSGLGLAIVKEIAEKHGGEVWTSHDNGKGATFSFSISKYI